MRMNLDNCYPLLLMHRAIVHRECIERFCRSTLPAVDRTGTQSHNSRTAECVLEIRVRLADYIYGQFLIFDEQHARSLSRVEDLMIHYHGIPVTPDTAAAQILARRHAMVSFAHPDQIELVADACQSFALDNGAFSAWRAGVSYRRMDGVLRVGK